MLKIRVDSDRKPIALQTPILHFAGNIDGQNTKLDLIGAIHLGSADYYAELNRRFESYDSVCVELIIPKNAQLAHLSQNGPDSKFPAKPLEAVPAAQKILSRWLKLVPQLSAVNYRRPNLVVADLTQEEVEEAIAQSDETGNFFRSFFLSFFFENKISPQEIVFVLRGINALAAKDRTGALRRFCAKNFVKADQEDKSDIPFESILIQRRNQAAVVQVLKEITSGKSNIALFYGTEHLRDLSDRFEKLGFTFTGCDWIDAWPLQ